MSPNKNTITVHSFHHFMHEYFLNILRLKKKAIHRLSFEKSGPAVHQENSFSYHASQYNSASLLNACRKDNSRHHFVYAQSPTLTGWVRGPDTASLIRLWAPQVGGVPQRLLPVSYDKPSARSSRNHGMALNAEQEKCSYM